jgi:hypothetical protein
MGVFLNKHLISFDLKKALQQSAFPEIKDPRHLIHSGPSFEECYGYLNLLYEFGLKGGIIDFDIEVVNEELFCLGFAASEDEAVVIPFVKGGDYWTIEQEATVMESIAAILEHPEISIRGQNLVFDISFMHRKYGISTNGVIHDTMIAQKITMTDYPAGLDFITSMHTDFPYYKAEGKKYIKVGGEIQTFWEYNGLDVLATARAHPKQVADLERQGNVPTYHPRPSIHAGAWHKGRRPGYA